MAYSRASVDNDPVFIGVVELDRVGTGLAIEGGTSTGATMVSTHHHLAFETSSIQDASIERNARQQRIVAFLPLVRTIACRQARRLPASVDVDDLINVGVLGLIDAVDRFDADRGVPFKAYAEIRIQGAIVDSLRKDDFVPRSVRRKKASIDQALTIATRRLGREPKRKELARLLDTDESGLDKMTRDSRIMRLVSLDAPTGSEGEGRLVDALGSSGATAEQLLCLAESRKEVVHAVRCLPERERVTLSMYYLGGKNLRQIGEALGVSESRACQLKREGIKRLKFRLDRNAAA